jgi:hypothetical protein
MDEVDFVPEAESEIYIPPGSDVHPTHVLGRFDTPIDPTFDELRALSVVYFFVASPERYAAFDALQILRLPRFTRAKFNATFRLIMSDTEITELARRARALNSQRQKGLERIRIGVSTGDEFRSRLAVFRDIVVQNQPAFLPHLMGSRMVVSASLMCTTGSDAAFASVLRSCIGFLDSVSDELVYIGVCAVFMAQLARSFVVTTSPKRILECFVQSAIAAVVPSLAYKNWIMEIIRVIKTGSELAQGGIGKKLLGDRWGPWISWLHVLVNNDALECLVGLLVGGIAEDEEMRALYHLRCVDLLLVKVGASGVLPGWIEHILKIGLDVYKLWTVALVAARDHQAQKGLFPTSSLSAFELSQMEEIVAHLHAKIGVPSYVPKKLARTLLLAAASGAVFYDQGEVTMQAVLNTLLSTHTGAVGQMGRCLFV